MSHPVLNKNLPPASDIRAGDGGEYVDNNEKYCWKGAIYAITETDSTSLVVFEKIKG